ncbi:MAG: hypothetical protein AVDCRST_MAG50-2124, partial [uncultured Acidimicrobiales bacterium]
GVDRLRRPGRRQGGGRGLGRCARIVPQGQGVRHVGRCGGRVPGGGLPPVLLRHDAHVGLRHHDHQHVVV